MTGAPAEGTDSDYAGGAKGVDESFLHNSYKPLKTWQRIFGGAPKQVEIGKFYPRVAGQGALPKHPHPAACGR
jgi:hypothetical protein